MSAEWTWKSTRQKVSAGQNMGFAFRKKTKNFSLIKRACNYEKISIRISIRVSSAFDWKGEEREGLGGRV